MPPNPRDRFKGKSPSELSFRFSGVQSISVPALLVSHCDCVGYPNIAVPIIRTGISPSRLPGTDYIRKGEHYHFTSESCRRVMTS